VLTSYFCKDNRVMFRRGQPNSVRKPLFKGTIPHSSLACRNHFIPLTLDAPGSTPLYSGSSEESSYRRNEAVSAGCSLSCMVPGSRVRVCALYRGG